MLLFIITRRSHNQCTQAHRGCSLDTEIDLDAIRSRKTPALPQMITTLSLDSRELYKLCELPLERTLIDRNGVGANLEARVGTVASQASI